MNLSPRDFYIVRSSMYTHMYAHVLKCTFTIEYPVCDFHNLPFLLTNKSSLTVESTFVFMAAY